MSKGRLQVRSPMIYRITPDMAVDDPCSHEWGLETQGAQG